MAFSLTWLPDVLEQAGLKVALCEGWETRGRGEMGHIFGVICHHTAGGKQGNMGSLKILRDGRPAAPGVKPLAGPLSQLGLGRDGTYYVIAAGRCNHAGEGFWKGLANGNSNFIGIEAENTGRDDDFPWPAVQLEAYQRGVAAILKHIGRSADFCCGHREYALPAGRKSDPTLDMNEFRIAVSNFMSGAAPPPVLIPDVEPTPTKRPTLRRGATGDLVKVLQATLHINATAGGSGVFGPATEAAVRAFQREHGMVPDGIVGPKTWAALDKLP
jgi:N-acetyl-anhydromuramyl-L-alanine amidase AmpD